MADGEQQSETPSPRHYREIVTDNEDWEGGDHYAFTRSPSTTSTDVIDEAIPLRTPPSQEVEVPMPANWFRAELLIDRMEDGAIQQTAVAPSRETSPDYSSGRGVNVVSNTTHSPEYFIRSQNGHTVADPNPPRREECHQGFSFQGTIVRRDSQIQAVR